MLHALRLSNWISHAGERGLTGACTRQPPQIPALVRGTWGVRVRLARKVAGGGGGCR